MYIESKVQHNLSTKDDYLRIQDVEVAINMNALEQRMITKQKVLNMLVSRLSIEKLIEKLEEEIHLDRHRLVKYYSFSDG